MVNTIRVQQFRSYKDDSFEFDSGINIIVGPNASGKTNLLEAILMICKGKSYRAKDVEIIMHGQDWARIDAFVPDTNRALKLVKLPGDSIQKTITINDEVTKRITQQKQLPIVLFEPNHLQLFQHGPEDRRDYLDDLLEQTAPGFSGVRKNYKRALSQRNRLLKQHPINARQQLFVWNIRLSELGGQIAELRKELVDDLNKRLPKLYAKLSKSKVKFQTNYFSNIHSQQYASELLHKLESSTETDIERGFTQYGPHRDDLRITLNGHDIQDSASRGEIRTLMLALKIVELGIVEEVYDKKPILLLDDVFSELDGSRRRALTDFLQSYQTFITTTDADVVIQHFTGDCRIIPLTN